jgi:uncharacterized protein (DUF952 family)
MDRFFAHITSREAWQKAQAEGAYRASSLESEGFIHCSTFMQAPGTANIFFKGQVGLVILCIDGDRLKSECNWEAPTGGGAHDPAKGMLFPHIYGPINLSAVVKVVDFPKNEDGSFSLPKELANEIEF